ncbi:restriction endonuclease subunit S [Curtobacterium citreum]|uniref:Restriction endonuclease subunit S n=1 Tax=Curtobacterium citreum TaxID=2036 RepID=A0ABU8YAK9_9MICO
MSREQLRTVASERGLVGGPFGSSLVNADYTDDGVPVIRGTNMSAGRFIGGEFAFVSHEKFARDLIRNSAVPGDIIYTQRGTLGQVALVPNGGVKTYVVSQSQMRLRVDPQQAIPEFVYYASTTKEFLKQIDDRAISTGVPHTNLGILAELEIPLPPLAEQRAIAEVLGALDDKIAANTVLAATTAQLASTDFAATVRQAKWGPSFEEIADISGGGTPSTKNPAFWDGEVWWATPTDMTALVGPYLESTSRKITPDGLAKCSSKLFAPGAILMTSRATIGALAINGVPTALNQGFIAVEPHDPRLMWWLFHEMESRVQEFISWANGATFLELSRGNFKRLSVRLIDEAALSAFHLRVTPLHDLARRSLAENRRLAAIRDMLLPQLMSGKLRVGDAEAAASEAGVWTRQA